MYKLSLLFLICFSSAISASEVIGTSNTVNPPPTTKLSDFDRIEISKFSLPAPYAGQEANEKAKENLQVNFDQRTQSWLSTVNSREIKSTEARVLLVEPVITKIKFITGGKRFWAGAFAGDSRVLINMKLTDKATGAVIANPEFYQQANAIGATWTFGATDKTMLERITSLMSDYLAKNYTEAVGGPTGIGE